MSEQKKINIDFEFLDEKKDVKTEKIAKVAAIEPAKKEEIKAESKEKNKTSNNTNAWLRLGARYIDLFLLGVLAGILGPSILLDVPNVIVSMISLLVWVFIESILLSSWGSTPGKWLLKIKVDRPGKKIDFSSALNRSFNVWYKGWGFGVPFVNIYALISSYNHLTKEGVTPWDKDGDFVVSYGKIGFIRIVAVVIISLIFIFFLFS